MFSVKKIISTVTDIKSYLQDANRDAFGNRTWANLYTSVGLSQAQAEAQINKQFGQSVGEAYAAASAQRSSIASSNIGQGYRELLNKDLQASLSEAYNSYLSSRSTSLSELSSNVESAYSSIDEALEEQATKTQSLQQEYLNYYDWLREDYESTLLANPLFTGYKTPIEATDEEGNTITDEFGEVQYATDEEGNTQYRLLTSTELMSRLYGEAEDGSRPLTTFGTDFYDMMSSYYAVTGEVPSFEDYLSENNSDLLEWAISSNPYDYNLADTNLGSFKEAVGLESTDNTYTFLERRGGLTEEQVDTMFESFSRKAQDLSDKIINATSDGTNLGELSGDAVSVIEGIESSIDDLQEMAETLGITEKDLGFSWATLNSELSNYADQAMTKGEMTADWFATTGKDTLQGTVTGAAMGAAVGAAAGGAAGAVGGSLLPGAGTAAGGAVGGAGGAASGAASGAIAGAIVGFIVGIIHASINTNNQRITNQRVGEAAIKTYQKIVNEMITLAKSKGE